MQWTWQSTVMAVLFAAGGVFAGSRVTPIRWSERAIWIAAFLLALSLAAVSAWMNIKYIPLNR
jgi:hypothetical protein